MAYIDRLAPPYSDRRLVLQLGRAVLLDRQVRHRVNAENLSDWRLFHRRTMRCNICGHEGRIFFEWPDRDRHRRHHIGVLRETLRCSGCHSKMRDRTVAAGLLGEAATRFGIEAATIEELAGRLPPTVRILDTDAHGYIGRRLARHAGTVRSLFVPGKANGEVLGDERMLNVDLEHMHFSDGTFDIIITSEVMEHVRHVEAAHREVARCLTAGGLYLFTVPYDDALAETWQLIDPVTDKSLVDPPHIHGDPNIRGGIKSYRVFGRDLIDALAACRLSAEFHLLNLPENGIFGGDMFQARHRSERDVSAVEVAEEGMGSLSEAQSQRAIG